jgi:hypothetical protein
MPAAPEHSTSVLSRTLRGRRLERVVLVLGVCLPVPVFASTGLAIPLPAAVERIAAAVVPFADVAAVQAAESLTRGSITLAPGERQATRSAPSAERETDSVAARVQNGRHAPAAGEKRRPSPGDERNGSSPLTPAPEPAAGAPASGSPADPAHEEPASSPARDEPPARPEPQAPPPPPPASDPPPPPPPLPPPPPPLPPPPPPPRPVEEVVDKVRETEPVVEEPVRDILPPPVKDAVDGLLPGKG